MTILKNYNNIIFLCICMISISISSNIEIVPLLSEHRQSVINLLISSFYVQEPLNIILQFDIPYEPLSWVDKLVNESIYEQCSFVAIDKTTSYNNVIGVILNGISYRVPHEDKYIILSEKIKFIMTLLDKIVYDGNLFELYKTDRLFHLDIVNVEENYRRQNLTYRLIEVSEHKARQLGLKAAYVTCSSIFSRKAFERQKFQVIKEILYSEYDNKRLHDMGEHDRCTLLAKRL